MTTNAYFRMGGNFSKGMTKGACYRLPGVPIIPRYGSECDNYGELLIHKAYKADEIQYRAHLNFAFAADGSETWESTEKGKDDLVVSYREAWLEAQGIFGGDSSLWVGKRFYDRWYMEMWDFFVLNHNGTGFGAENLDVGKGKVDVALLRHFINGTSDPLHVAGDVQWHDVEALGGKVQARWIFSQKGSKGQNSATDDYYSATGHFLTLNYQLPLGNMTYQTFLQYGAGIHGARPDAGAGGQTGSTMSNFSSTSFAKATALSEESNKAWKKSSTFRWTHDLQLFPTSTVMSWDLGLSYTKADFGGALGANGEKAPDRTTLAVGAHPTYYLSKIWAIDADIFYASIDKGLPLTPFNGVAPASLDPIDRDLTKLTLGLVVRPGVGQYAKPQIRFYVTQADWNDAQKGDSLITDGNAVYATNTAGTTWGVQGEVWW